jgi:hypothetical protein
MMSPIAESIRVIKDAEAVYDEAKALHARFLKKNDSRMMILANRALESATLSLNAAKKTLLSACKLDDAQKALYSMIE